MRRDPKDREFAVLQRRARVAWRDAVRTLPGRIETARFELSVAKAKLGDRHAEEIAAAHVRELEDAFRRINRDIVVDELYRRASVRADRERGPVGRARWRADVRNPLATLKRWARSEDDDSRAFARDLLKMQGIDLDALELGERPKRGRRKGGLMERVREALQCGPRDGLSASKLAKQLGVTKKQIQKACAALARCEAREFGRRDTGDGVVYFARRSARI